jgi:spore germination cell wall hydrolase CwlJ-like protein
MLNIHALRRDSADHRLWLSARRIAAEILSGHSSDPTLGSLFYHTVDVQPNWSRGIDPVTQIGSHLFFTRAAQASG